MPQGISAVRLTNGLLLPYITPYSRRNKSSLSLRLTLLIILCTGNAVIKQLDNRSVTVQYLLQSIRVLLKPDGTRRRTGGEVKGKLTNGVCSQYPSHYLGTWCIQHYYH